MADIKVDKLETTSPNFEILASDDITLAANYSAGVSGAQMFMDGSAGEINFSTGGGSKWQIDSTGHLKDDGTATTGTGTYDISARIFKSQAQFGPTTASLSMQTNSITQVDGDLTITAGIGNVLVSGSTFNNGTVSVPSYISVTDGGGYVNSAGTYKMDGVDVINEFRTFVGSGGVNTSGSVFINNTSPTIYFQDTDHRSAMIHVDGNSFHVLRGSGTNSTTWDTYNGYWPLVLNLENNDASFGGNVSVIGSINTDDRYRIDGVEVITTSRAFVGSGGVSTVGTINTDDRYRIDSQDVINTGRTFVGSGGVNVGTAAIIGGSGSFNSMFVGSNNLNCTGSIAINNSSPTIYLQNTDHRSCMLHCNSSQFYVLRGSGTNSNTWETTNGNWPFVINLENNDAFFGGHVYIPSNRGLYNTWNMPSLGVDYFVWRNSSSQDRIAIETEAMLRSALDNFHATGWPGYRWTSVWSANGTIQTSDSRLKTNIQNSVLGLDFINALRPVSYKWIDGKTVVNEVNGEEVVSTIPGQRTHWGLIAQEVKTVIDAAGVDFGGWVLNDVEDPDSTQSLRYDQFVAPLIKAVQELKADCDAKQAAIDDLLARVAALETP